MKAEKNITDYLKDFYFYAKFLVLNEDRDRERDKRIKKDLKVLKKTIKHIENEEYEEVFTQEQNVEDLYL